MAIFLPRIIQAKRVLKRSISNGCSTSTSIDIPKGYFAVYVGEEEKRRFVVPISLLSQPAFQELLHLAEEEFGYNHSMGGLTIPCSEDIFSDIASRYAKRVLKRSFSNGSSTSIDIQKGYFAVYVGEEEKRRFVVPVSLLSQPGFQELLHLAEEQFGYNHPMGGLTIPCSEDTFADIASRFGAL
ncbi:hypothetical protein E3N88_08597 [Mikania micrantha]|uniref:Uncharacterized protein n=1 Tax=Mikania micrantha TaxID=192012 RepID=A0A5N6PIK9_9ASTR|nr:hypothetical protein E3N88_08597 [Mikania micrantha]